MGCKEFPVNTVERINGRTEEKDTSKRTKLAGTLFIVGIIIALAGVGTTEKTGDLMRGILIGVAGLGIMFIGTQLFESNSS